MYLEGKAAREYLKKEDIEGIKTFSQSGIRSYVSCPKEFGLYQDCGGLLGMDDKPSVKNGRKMDELILGTVEESNEGEENAY